jgi:hypothetical protein
MVDRWRPSVTALVIPMAQQQLRLTAAEDRAQLVDLPLATQIAFLRRKMVAVGLK